MNIRTAGAAGLLALACALSTAAAAAPPGGDRIAAALADPRRPAAEVARDPARHPAELIRFAGIRPGDRVADYFPGGGYYDRILSDVVGPQGRVYGFIPAEMARNCDPSEFAGGRATNSCTHERVSNRRSTTVRYLCLIYDDESKMGTMSKEQGDAIMGEYFAFTEGIKKSGQYVAGEALQPTQTATTVRLRNGKVSSTDGPFAETKEQLGGFYLIEAKDLNEAIQIGSRIPGAKVGSIEVRPVVGK